jgi:signal transduction histidine kinase
MSKRLIAVMNSLFVFLFVISFEGMSQKPDSLLAAQLSKQAYGYIYTFPDSALLFSDSALQVARRSKILREEAEALRRKGTIYWEKGMHKNAQLLFLDALTIFEKIGDLQGRADVIMNLGTLYNYQDNSITALRYLHQAAFLHRKNNNYTRLSVALFNIGEAHTSLKHYDSAFHYLYESLHISQKYRLIQYGWFILNDLGALHLQLNHLDSAEYYLIKAFNEQPEGINKRSYSQTLHQLGCLRYSQKRYTEAQHLAESALTNAKASMSVTNLRDCYELLTNIYTAQHQFETALQSYRQYVLYKDSIANVRLTQAIFGQQLTYEQEQKQKELRLLAQEKEEQQAALRQQQFFGVIMAVLLVVVSLALLNVYRLRQKIERANSLLRHKNHEVIQQREELASAAEELQIINQQLSEKNEKLEDLNREKDGLISIVAHDLKSPLNNIKGLTDIILLENEVTDNQRAYIQMIDKIIFNGQNLITDLLIIISTESTLKPLQLQSVDLDAFFTAALSPYYKQAQQKNIALSHTIDKPNRRISTEEDSLQRIIDNLVSNALKFTPVGGHVKVSIVCEKNFSISVSDTGPGISEEDQRKMFRKFQKLKARPTAGESSTGLGLSIVKALTERLSGSIQVASELGQGTTFTVSLPTRAAH